MRPKIDMVRPQKGSVRDNDIYLGQVYPATPSPVSKKERSKWVPIVIGFSLFLIGGGMSIVTLLGIENTSASPLVVVSVASTTEPLELSYGPQPMLSQPSFFADTLKSFKKEQQSFVEANLSEMYIRYYELGVVKFEAPILSKGKEGLWWETPAGLYAIQSKEKNHLSSFGGVYQPWSMAFQGNFFIHGWPYYPNGDPVSSKYSGGCIRLSDESAKKLYDFVTVDTPVLVYEKDIVSDDFFYDVPSPALDAQSYLIVDIQNSTILAEANPELTLPIASITKLMTALVATEYINLDKNIYISEASLVYTSVPRLKKDSQVSAYALLFPLLLESSNEAAEAFGRTLGKDRFVQLMNEKARALGMTSTTFADTSGADSGNVSTAHDLVRLLTYIYNNRSFILKIASGTTFDSAYNAHSFGELSNFNTTPDLSGFIGGKVGKTTAAKETTLVAYEMNIKGVPRIIVFAILGTEDRFSSLSKLYEYVQNQFGASNMISL